MEKKWKDRFINRSCKDNARHIQNRKVLKRKGNKSLVKWVDYSDAFNSLVDKKSIVGNL